MKKGHKKKKTPHIPQTPPTCQECSLSETNLLSDDNKITGESGQHFHMDFGFVRGSEYKVKNETGPTITSIDGFNSYLIIVDRVTRYIWIFLTTSKSPPINVAQRVLNKFKSNNTHRTVERTRVKNLLDQPNSNKW